MSLIQSARLNGHDPYAKTWNGPWTNLDESVVGLTLYPPPVFLVKRSSARFGLRFELELLRGELCIAPVTVVALLPSEIAGHNYSAVKDGGKVYIFQLVRCYQY